MSEQSFAGHSHQHRGGILERISSELFGALEHASRAEELVTKKGLLQPLDPRIKLLSLLAFIVTTVFSQSLLVICGLLILAIVLALASRISLRRAMLRVWLSVLLFTGIISLPAIFLGGGQIIAHLPWLGWPITEHGLRSFGYMVGRSLTAASFAVLLILTTSWPHVLKALHALRVPSIFIVILGMTYRYIFLFLKLARDMFEARRSRMLTKPSRAQARRMAIANSGVLLSRSIQMSGDVYDAMLARGYRGQDATLGEFHMRRRDWLALAVSCLTIAPALWFGVGVFMVNGW